MKNKSLIIAVSVLVSLLSLYFLSFTWISNGVQKDAEAFGTDKKGNIDYSKKQYYLDSVWNEPVFEILGLEYTYSKIKKQELQLGLDLQGGMHVTVEVSPVEIVRVLANNSNNPGFNQALAQAQEKAKTDQRKFTILFKEAFNELSPGTKLSSIFANSSTKGRIDFNSNDDQVLRVIDSELDGSIERSYDIIRTRIDQFGTIQPNIQRIKGTNRIQIELPGVNNPARVRDLVQSSANLEFWEVWKLGETYQYLTKLNDYLVSIEKTSKTSLADSVTENKLSAEPSLADTSKKENLNPLAASNDTNKLSDQTKAKGDSAKKDTTQKASSLFSKYFQIIPFQDQSNDGRIIVPKKDTSKINKLLREAKLRGIFPANVRFAFGAKSDPGAEMAIDLYMLKNTRDGKARLDGKVITNAYWDVVNGKQGVGMQMNPEGAKVWRNMTRDNTNRRIAIALDGYILSAPNVEGEIPSGTSSITGSFTIDEAKDMANKLKSGRMPAPVKIVEEAIVGPTLGQESINQGLLSSLVGVLAVIIFMVIYYSKGGFVADVALLFNIFFIFGVMVQLPGGAVLTLPGIAGIVLTMGMSVDANVLIFERIREELSLGIDITTAIKTGYAKAFSSIFDSNVTTFLTGVILALLGTGPVQGFAVTLIIGILTSFFTAVYISRLIIEWMATSKNGITENSFSTGFSKGLFKETKFNIIGNRKKAYMASAALIVVGFTCIAIKGGLALGVDFKGGRSYIVQFDKYVSASEVRSEMMKNFKNAGTEVKTYGSNTKLKITTSFLAENDANEADAQVLAGLNEGLKKFSNDHPEVLSSSKVGATVADEIKNKSYLAIALALLVIFVYVLIRFRNVSFSAGAVIALFHDVLAVIAVLGIFAMFGVVYEIDQIMIAAILTLIGYSINDTVVIFDRIRENINANPNTDLEKVLNDAINQTFSRTIITALTVFVVLIVLYIFGGEVLAGFSFALLFGLFFGSYSTIFIASPIVLDLGRKGIEAASANSLGSGADQGKRKVSLDKK